MEAHKRDMEENTYFHLSFFRPSFCKRYDLWSWFH